MSLNNTQKFHYKDYEDDIVRASEYIFLSSNSERYAIFKLVNNYSSSINDVLFHVIQYDADDNIINRGKIRYNGFTAKAYSSFVPKTKMLLDENTTKLEIFVTEATFEDNYLIDGVLQEINREVEEEDEELKVLTDNLTGLTTFTTVNVYNKIGGQFTILFFILLLCGLAFAGIYFGLPSLFYM